MPKSKVSSNGDFLRMIADWFDENVESAKKKFRKTKTSRGKSKDETKWETVKYYLQQMHNTNRMAFNSLFEYLAKLANVGLIDNAILRKAEQAYAKLNGDDKKFVQWLKKHNTISSYLSYYFMIAAISLSTLVGVKHHNRGGKDEPKEKKEIIIAPNNEEEILVPEEDEEEKKNNKDRKQKSKTYDLNDANFVSDFIEENWEDIVIGLLEFETYNPKPKLHKGEERYTYGPGLTWVYIKDKKGNIIQKPCTGEYKRRADKFTKQEIWNQVRIHITKESIPVVKRALLNKGITHATTEQIIGLFLASYQFPAHAQQIVNGISSAGNNLQKQLDAFQYYKGRADCKNGTLKRRWWCAMYYAGKITSDDLLELNRDAFSGVNVNVFLVKRHFVSDKATIQYALGLTNNKTTVRTFIEQEGLFALEDKKSKPKETITPEENQENPSMAEMVTGLDAFKSGKYNIAINHYEKAIALNPDNMEAYSSLSFAYTKLGDKYLEAGNKQRAIDCYKKSIAAVKNGNARMNANKDLLHDNKIKAALYYNAGQSRDKLGNIYRSQKKLEAASREFDLASKNYQTALDNAEQVDIDDSVKNIYIKAKEASLLNKAELDKQIKAQQEAQKKATKTATIKTATSKTKYKDKKKQAFATVVVKLKAGQTFDASSLFVTGSEHSA